MLPPSRMLKGGRLSPDRLTIASALRLIGLPNVCLAAPSLDQFVVWTSPLSFGRPLPSLPDRPTFRLAYTLTTLMPDATAHVPALRPPSKRLSRRPFARPICRLDIPPPGWASAPLSARLSDLPTSFLFAHPSIHSSGRITTSPTAHAVMCLLHHSSGHQSRRPPVSSTTSLVDHQSRRPLAWSICRLNDHLSFRPTTSSLMLSSPHSCQTLQVFLSSDRLSNRPSTWPIRRLNDHLSFRPTTSSRLTGLPNTCLTDHSLDRLAIWQADHPFLRPFFHLTVRSPTPLAFHSLGRFVVLPPHRIIQLDMRVPVWQSVYPADHL
ncbi:hypothetical protein EIP91_001344 [Steccherinum ochraceum]|uniref:Uncharacterized protein n=1 Tax=Steccherinum ochraceum TaxID=92696 RepID=A0A4R0RUV0_9APHY|nr:hypothetical protein EIP91_001344 [Steccherinum ochraceum]